MTYYHKPHKLKYTDLAIWIDKNAYSDDCDENRLFEYLYHIFKMLATHDKFFKRAQDYDDFALYAATKMFMRYKNPKQDINTSRVQKIKSSLNYAKKLSYPLKIQYLHEAYNSVVSELDEEYVSNSLRSYIMSSVDALNVSYFKLYMMDIEKTARAFLTKIPYKENSSQWLCIYASVLLTFLNSITPTKKYKDQIETLNKSNIPHKDKFYDIGNKDIVVLYHLDESYHDYVLVLSNELRHVIYTDLSQMLHTYVPSDVESVVRAETFVTLCNKGDEEYCE